jgi:hypothetical protein
VIIEPNIPIFVSVSGTVSVSVSASVTIGASMSWNSSDPSVLHVNNLSQPLRFHGGPVPGMSVTGEGTVGFYVQPQLDIYDAAGPNLEAGVYATAEINLTPPPGGSYLTITPQLRISAGLDLNLLGYDASLELRLATLSFTPFTIGPVPNAVLTLSPSDPQVLPGDTLQFSSTRSDGVTGYPVTWSLVGAAGDTITSSGLFTAAGPPGRTVTVEAVDSTGAAGETVVTIGTPFNAVGNLVATQDSSSLGASVSWTAPSSTGGSPISDYLVTVSDGIANQTTSSASASIPSLEPGIIYTISVYPVNTAGVTGPPATTSLEVYPLCTDSFTGGATGTSESWNTASNWSTGVVPTSLDWVCTNGYDITLPASSISVQASKRVAPSPSLLEVTSLPPAG